MPFEIEFTKKLPSLDRDLYINDCCVGGDVVAGVLLPSIAAIFGEQKPVQEDWGWFIWFDHAGVRLSVDIGCDDPESGSYRIFLTSRRQGWLKVEVMGTEELDTLLETILDALQEWLGYPPTVESTPL
ncbi:hypothetical protein CDL60_04650 [Roseateles noduli]|nr:hypothetical protein CDL60_04650 [Roseateles noduli]